MIKEIIIILILFTIITIPLISLIRRGYFDNRTFYKLIEKDGLPYISLKIGKRKCLFLIDTGTQKSIIDTKLATECKCNIETLNTEKKLYIALPTTNIKHMISQKTVCNINLNHLYKQQFEFLCVDNLEIDGILGLDWIKANKVHILPNRKRITFPNNLINKSKKR